MPFGNPIEARDEMFSRFKAAWPAASTAIIGEAVETRWQGKEKGTIPQGYFVRVSTNTAGTQSGGFLQNGDGQSPQAFDTFGSIFVQVFAPMSGKDAYRNGELLAIAARDIFRAAETQGGVWFRNARYTETDNDGVHFGWKVTADFEFTEV